MFFLACNYKLQISLFSLKAQILSQSDENGSSNKRELKKEKKKKKCRTKDSNRKQGFFERLVSLFTRNLWRSSKVSLAYQPNNLG